MKVQRTAGLNRSPIGLMVLLIVAAGAWITYSMLATSARADMNFANGQRTWGPFRTSGKPTAAFRVLACPSQASSKQVMATLPSFSSAQPSSTTPVPPQAALCSSNRLDGWQGPLSALNRLRQCQNFRQGAFLPRPRITSPVPSSTTGRLTVISRDSATPSPSHLTSLSEALITRCNTSRTPALVTETP